MHSFAVVASKPGHHVPEPVRAFLQQADTDALAFVPADHVCWHDDASTVFFAGWQAVSDAVQLGSHWHVGPRGITAFSGRLWPKGRMWNAAEPWARQLDSYWQSHAVVNAEHDFDGIYAAVSLASSGVGTIVTDPLSVALLYRVETNDFVAFSTSARLASEVLRSADGDRGRDPLTLAWLCLLGYVVGDGTGFVGTRVVPAGSYVDIAPAFGARLASLNATPWATPDSGVDEEELIASAHEALSRSVLSISQLPADERVADITGGRDSRLVLAIMLQEGVASRFTFGTAGAEYTPDSVVSRAIAERFQLTHKPATPSPMDSDEFRRRLETHVFQTSGARNPWDFKGGLVAAARPKVTGLFGEILSTNYKNYPVLHSRDDLKARFHAAHRVDAPSILRADVKAELVARLDLELLERVDAGGSAPQDLLDTYYVRQRLRRWLGTAEELGESGRVFPLYSVSGLRAAFALGPDKRRSEWLTFSIMRRACPELTKMPLGDKPWSEDLYGHLPDASDYRVPAVTHTGSAPVLWQLARIADNRDVVEEYLLDEPSNPLYEIVDRDEALRMLRDPGLSDPQQFRQIFGALAAVVWLNRRESRSRIGDGEYQRVESVPSPAPAPSPARGRLLSRRGRRSGTQPTV